MIEDLKSDMLGTYKYIYNFDVCYIAVFDKSEYTLYLQS
jgi:hypothetical protein